MLIGRISGATRRLGAPANWKEEDHGRCDYLPIRDEQTPQGPVMTSAWEPTPDELALILKGAPVMLTVWGTAHPPVALHVGEPPREDTPQMATK